MARYALVVGISKYEYLPSPLSKPVGDAEAVANLLRSHGDFQEVILLNKPRLTKDELFTQVKKLLLEQGTGSEVLIYYTGHGVPVEDCGVEQVYLAPSDCKVTKESVTGGIPFEALNKLIGASQLSGLVMLLDCCHSGSLLNSVVKTFTAFSNTNKNYALIAACRDFEEAAAMRSEPHSIFTGALLQGLARENANAQGQINASTLFGFIEDRLQQRGQEAVKLGYGQRIKIVDYRAVVAEKVTKDICPYVGLEAFTKETAKFFKGRDRFVRLLLQKLTESNFVPVIGASGSGKSSLVRAGLISELEAQGNWQILEPIKPGDFSDNPVMGISSLLSKLCQRADTKREISNHIAAGNLAAAIACLSQPKNLLLVIDQFEEIFTVCPAEREAERQQFIDLLVGITQHPDSRLRVVTTMRADFFDNCLRYRGLGEVLQDHQVLLLPMNEVELQEAIAAPAEVGKYELGEGLLQGILRDVRHEKNVLPLLEFALTQLWERRENRRLTYAAYDALGGVMGGLNQHADRLYDSLKPQEQEWAKWICLMLVSIGRGEKDTRQRRTKKELLQQVGDRNLSGLEMALEELVRGRLLATGGDRDTAAWVDIAHEALMEEWTAFANWRSTKRDLLRLVDRVQEAFEEWQHHGESEMFLLPQGVISQIEDVTPDINDYLITDQQKFIQCSQIKYKPWLDPANLPEMVDIPGGSFQMGSPDGNTGNDNEKPYHQVTIPAFRMGKYPITQAQWRTVASSPKINLDLILNPSRFRGDDRPVERVTWHEAQEFCVRLSIITGQSYCLPTEAEWEYACRAGAKDYHLMDKYCFGDDESKLEKYAWYGNRNGCTYPVGKLLPNVWGLYDMHGNVWEWCVDEWHENYKTKPQSLKDDGSKPWSEIKKDNNDDYSHLLRGGSWYANVKSCRSAYRNAGRTGIHNDGFGFRVVCRLQ